MEIQLSNNDVIEILAVNFEGRSFDWRRKEGYNGACVSVFEPSGIETLEDDIRSVLKSELSKGGE